MDVFVKQFTSQLSAKVTPDFHKQVVEEAKKRELTISQLVRLAVIKFVEKKGK